MIEQSGNLTAYYLAILNWIETGKSVFPFQEDYGLCGNAFQFTGENGVQKADMLIEEMRGHFANAGLDHILPFNNVLAGETPFRSEVFKYQNPKRLQWIKNHASI